MVGGGGGGGVVSTELGHLFGVSKLLPFLCCFWWYKALLVFHWVSCADFHTFAFKTWIYLMHCFITKVFSNFILIVSKWLTLYVQLGLVICIFSTCVPREKAGFFKRTKVILFYNVVLLSIWLWHSSLTSVISLCLGLLIHIIICQRSTVIQQ